MQPKLEQECFLPGQTQPAGKQRQQKNPKIQSIVKCVEVVELSPVSNFLKVAAVE